MMLDIVKRAEANGTLYNFSWLHKVSLKKLQTSGMITKEAYEKYISTSWLLPQTMFYVDENIHIAINKRSGFIIPISEENTLFKL